MKKATKLTAKITSCSDCGAAIGQLHEVGCDVERCPCCGLQALGCQHFNPNDSRRQTWDGKWPGEADCERLGFFVNGTKFPELNRLYITCVWNADTQRWELVQPG
jgi:hypothetical protein